MALYVGYGLESAQRIDGSSESWTQIYADVVHLAQFAEDAGFDSVWVTEHHFTEDGYMSALLPVLAAMAVKTSKVLLGTNVALAPFYHPLRIAEDAATVDVLSHGRLILGLGIGYRDPEFEVFQVPKSERVARITEIVDVCRKAWTGERFDFRGNEVLVRPVPPGAQIWLGGWVDAAMRRAGRLADGYISPSGGIEDTRARLHVVDKAAARTIGVATATFVSCTADGEMRPGAQQGLQHMMRWYGDWYGSSSDHAGGKGLERRGTAEDPTAGMVVGTPDQVRATLTPFAREFSRERDHHMCVRLRYPGMSRKDAEEHITMFAREVLPALREASV